MNVPIFFAAANAATTAATAGSKSNQLELVYIWEQATVEAKIIIFCLAIFSIMAWSVMISKAVQMRRAKKLNFFFKS